MIYKKILTLIISLTLFSCGGEDEVKNYNLDNQKIDSSIFSDNYQFLELLNEVRIKGYFCNGLYMKPTHKLEYNYILEKTAREHSEDMAKNNFVNHINLKGLSANNRIINNGYKGITAETIAAGQSNIEILLNELLESKEHCQILMSPLLTEIGNGYYYEDKSYYKYYWTQNYGNPN